jgi:HEAT repeat protein
VRSNAARACGAIGDRSSIPLLLRALDLESGLSRASIVRALGALKATQALPALATLFSEASSDERRRRGAGYRASQSGAEARAQYESLANLDALRADWNELAEAALPRPVNPRQNEELLSPRLILDAVRAIGPEASQDFYRTLAGEKDVEARAEAAARLAEGTPAEAPCNVLVLRNLLADSEEGVRVSAAVSLLVLGEDARAPILGWLKTGRRWERATTIRQLARVADRSLLDFALEALLAAAADDTLEKEIRAEAAALAK